jgi:hypothetical protein
MISKDNEGKKVWTARCDPDPLLFVVYLIIK